MNEKFNEQDVTDSVMKNLPVGGESLPLTENQQDSYDALKAVFERARPFY